MPTVVTFEGPLYHKKHGLVRVRISREVTATTGSQLAATQSILAVREPALDDVWQGDMVEIFDRQGTLIETHTCTEQEEEWTSTLTDSGNYSTNATKSTRR